MTYAKYLTPIANSNSTYVSYSGLGAVLARERLEPLFWETEEFRVDAQGNVLRSRAATSDTIRMPQQSTYSSRGALRSRVVLQDPNHAQAGDNLTQGFDADGPLAWAAHIVVNGSGTETVSSFTMNHYGGDGKLHASTRYNFLGSSHGGAWEEYRYDALGRRVLVISRSGTPQACIDANASGCVALCSGVNGCVDGVTRTQWGGDQMLSETRDTLSGSSSSIRYGTITYLHGLDLDHPLAFLDSKVVNGSQVPNPNWRGQYESSVTTAGVAADCSLAPSTLCPTRNIAFPAGYGIYLRPSPVEEGSNYTFAWAGSLVTDQQDATGNLFRRNRYYDAGTGRFTQETPSDSHIGSSAMGMRWMRQSAMAATLPDVSELLSRAGGGVPKLRESAASLVTRQTLTRGDGPIRHEIAVIPIWDVIRPQVGRRLLRDRRACVARPIESTPRDR